MGGGLGCDTACIDDWFLYNSRHTFALLCVFLRFAKSGFGEAGLKDFALVNVASSP